MRNERDWSVNGEHWSENECKDRELGYKLAELQSGHYTMASIPDHSLNKPV